MVPPTKCKPLSVIGMIPARWASSRFPGKLLVPIIGKSVLQRTFECARRSSLLQDLLVVTDDERIALHVHGFGGRAVMTPHSCQTGSDRLSAALAAYPEFSRYDMVFCIQGDEPCFPPEALEPIANCLQEDPHAQAATAAVPLFDAEEAASSSVVKCVFDQRGNALYFSRSLIPHMRSDEKGCIAYKHLGLYCYRTHFLQTYASLPSTPLQRKEDLEQLKILEHGHRIKVALLDRSAERPHVDLPEDIQKVERYLCN